jgi:hypothetical protein
MFNDTFYPTPRLLAEALIAPLKLDKGYVLEPSAGKGDILDTIKAKYLYNRYDNTYDNHRMPRMYAVEIQPELRAILADKGYTIVGEDFLQYVPDRHYTHIVMNPPFNHCDDHLLHAWDILVQGEIACIYPITALDNPSEVRKQQVLRLIAAHGSIQELGSFFARGAERRTTAEVAIVRLTKKVEINEDEFGFDVENDPRIAPDMSNEGLDSEVALRSYVGDLLARYRAAIDAFAPYKIAEQRLTHYTQAFTDVKLGNYNIFVDSLTESAWQLILGDPRFQRLLTKRAREMFQAFRQRQTRVDFNEHNVKAMFVELLARQDELLNATIQDAFDTMTKYHKDNVEHFEGWKSNECWRINKRVIVPNCVRYPGYGNWEFSYHKDDEIDDVDRALCLVTGRNFDEITTIVKAVRGTSCGMGETKSTFFKIRMFKKETIHLWWLDDQVRQDFNIAAARGKGWLPPAKGAFA